MKINCIVCNTIHDIDMGRKVWNIDYGDLCCDRCRKYYDPVKRLNGEMFVPAS